MTEAEHQRLTEAEDMVRRRAQTLFVEMAQRDLVTASESTGEQTR